jgi:hypothetical protein
LRYGIDLNIFAPYVAPAIIAPPNAVISAQIFQLFIKLERYVIYTKAKSTYSFKKILEGLEITDLEFLVQLQRASRFTTFARDKFIFKPLSSDFVGNYTIPFKLYNTTSKRFSK